MDQLLVEGFLDKPLRALAKEKGRTLNDEWRALKLLQEILTGNGIQYHGKQGQLAIELRALALKLRTAGVLILNARSGRPINLNIDLHVNLNYDYPNNLKTRRLNSLKTEDILPWQLRPQIWPHRWNS